LGSFHPDLLQLSRPISLSTTATASLPFASALKTVKDQRSPDDKDDYNATAFHRSTTNNNNNNKELRALRLLTRIQ